MRLGHTKPRAPRLAVVGAGPAGLAATLAARQCNLEVVVFEQAPDFARIGGGVAIQSNGLRALAALGVLATFAPQLRTVCTVVVEDADGSRLSHLDFDAAPVPHNRIGVVLRADLQEHLLAAVERTGIEVQFGQQCTGVDLSAGATAVRLTNGGAYECDAVIAADGINSRLRASLGLGGHKRAVGEAYLRGVAQCVPGGETLREIWLDDGRRFGIAPLVGSHTYFYCSVPRGEWEDIRAHRLRPWIDGWRAALPEAAALLEAVPDWDRVSYDELHEVRLRRWWRSGGFVVGDAAHAMTPNLGQGANCALVDAVVLVRLLAEITGRGGSFDDVGRRYQAIRRGFVTRIQRAARQLGALARWSSPPGRLLRRVALATGRLGPVQRRAVLLGAGYNPAEDAYLGGGST